MGMVPKMIETHVRSGCVIPESMNEKTCHEREDVSRQQSSMQFEVVGCLVLHCQDKHKCVNSVNGHL
jgi:hypothetical protein